MTKTKKSWLDRLEDVDRKDQARLDRVNNSGNGKTIFQKSKRRRSGKQAEQEKTLKLTFVVYVFFIIEVCTLGGLVLGDSGNPSVASTIAIIAWSAILSISSVVMGAIALMMRPHVLYIHIPFILNCLLFFLVFIIFIF
jgi:hypothetical protein